MGALSELTMGAAVTAGSTAWDVHSTKDASLKNIGMDVVGFGAQEFIEYGVGIAVGGWALPVILAFHALSALLDKFWDPFASFYNADLDVMKTQYDDSYKQTLMENAGVTWPMEIKPSVIEVNEKGELSEETKNELIAFMRNWYIDNSLTSEAQRENTIKISDFLRKRMLLLGSYDPLTGYLLETKTTLADQVFENNENFLKLLTMLLAKRQGKTIGALPEGTSRLLVKFQQALEKGKSKLKAEHADAVAHIIGIAVFLCFVCAMSSSCISLVTSATSASQES